MFPPLTNFWNAYQIANPKTRPEDIKLLRAAIERLPQSPPLVRINERRPMKSGIKADAYVDQNKPDEIQVYRNGPRYQTKDPINIAAMLHHEQAHIGGADEYGARGKEVEFLQTEMDKGYKNTKLFNTLLNSQMQLKSGTGALGTYYKDK